MYANQPARPALDNEAHYEERFDNGKNGTPVWNASDVRVGTFQAVGSKLAQLFAMLILAQVFSGAAGFTYGANMVMQSYIPGLYDPDGSGPATPWYEQIHCPGSSQVGNVREVRAPQDLDSHSGGHLAEILAILGSRQQLYPLSIRTQ